MNGITKGITKTPLKELRRRRTGWSEEGEEKEEGLEVKMR